MAIQSFGATLARYSELILYKTYADLRAESERTYLGFIWWIVEPVLYMSVFYLFFGILLGHKTDNYVAFLLIGLTVWQWFKSCVSHGGETILGNSALMKQVFLPKVIFPTVLVLTDTVKFFFIFGLLLVFLWISGHFPNQAYMALPLLITIQFLFNLGMTYLLAAVIPFLPDLRFVVENFLLAVFFMSGIFVDINTIPAAAPYLDYYYMNPIVNLVEMYRMILLHQQFPPFSMLMGVAGFAVGGIVLGVAIIRWFEYEYPKRML